MNRRRTILFALSALLMTHSALADPITVPGSINEGATAIVSGVFTEPGSCSKTAALRCDAAAATGQSGCPANELCKPGNATAPTSATYRVDDGAAPHTCAAGANAGNPCIYDTDCPGSTCPGILVPVTTWAPNGSTFTFAIDGATVIQHADQPTEKHCLTLTWPWPLGICAGGICHGSAERCFIVNNLHWLP